MSDTFGRLKNAFYLCKLAVADSDWTTGCGGWKGYMHWLSEDYLVDCLSPNDCGGNSPYCTNYMCSSGQLPSIDSVSVSPSASFRFVEETNATFTVEWSDPENEMASALVDCLGNGGGTWTPLSRDHPITLECEYPGPGTYNTRIYLTDQYHPGDKSVYNTVIMNVSDNMAPVISVSSPSNGTVINRSYAELAVDVTDPDGDSVSVDFMNSSGGLMGTRTGIQSGTTSMYVMTGLQPGTEYGWSAAATDMYGAAESSIVSGTYTTRNTTAPSVVRHPAEFNLSTYENRNVNLSVNATDAEGDEISYSWFVNGVLTGEDSHSYEFTLSTIGHHVITVYASDGFLNNMTYWNVTVKISGDTNGDCIVNIYDLASVGLNYRTRQGDPDWSPDIDINGDGKVGLMDLAMTGFNYGREC